jgi:DNA-binding transcriptional LysR family regulator
MDLDSARIFTKIIELGSFTSAARYLKIPKPTVSRKITNLEEKLGVRLIERSTRQLRLTPNGERFLQYAMQITELVEDIHKDFQAIKEEPQGTLKIALSPIVGELYINRLLVSYMAQYPQVRIEILHTDQNLDPIKDGIDVIIWVGHLPKANLIAKWFSNSWNMLFASPRYLEKNGHPTDFKDLLNHRCIQLHTHQRAQWELHSKTRTQTVSPSFVLNTNNFWLAREAAIAGQGIALLPVLLLGEDVREKRLVSVLPEWSDNDSSIYAIFPSRKLLAPQVRAFLDLLDRNKDKNLITHKTPSITDPKISNFLNKMSLSTPQLIFNFDFNFE